MVFRMESFELSAGELRYEGKGIYKKGQVSQQLGTSDAPLVVQLETSTDWVAFGPSAAGVIVAMLVALLTMSVQKNQIQANISNFRQAWMAELRESGAEFIQIMTLLVNMTTQSSEYRETEAFIASCARAAQLKAKIDLLLSRNDEQSKILRDAAYNTLSYVSSLGYGSKKKKGLKMIGRYKTLLRAELEQAWTHTKDDLGINKKVVFSKWSAVVVVLLAGAFLILMVMFSN